MQHDHFVHISALSVMQEARNDQLWISPKFLAICCWTSQWL